MGLIIRNPFENKKDFPSCLRITEKFEQNIKECNNLKSLEKFLHKVNGKTFHFNDTDLYNTITIICFACYFTHSSIKLEDIYNIIQKIKVYILDKIPERSKEKEEEEEKEKSSSSESLADIESSSSDSENSSSTNSSSSEEEESSEN